MNRPTEFPAFLTVEHSDFGNPQEYQADSAAEFYAFLLGVAACVLSASDYGGTEEGETADELVEAWLNGEESYGYRVEVS